MMIIDVLAGTALVIGSLLVALGAFGLLRLPDVFTRMHAATKAATVGVIGTTAAAAVEAGAVGGVMVLLLVVALLFLSGPLGMSLLARAAYHDPETPMWKNTRELPIELPIPESTPSRRTGGTSPYLAAVALWDLGGGLRFRRSECAHRWGARGRCACGCVPPHGPALASCGAAPRCCTSLRGTLHGSTCRFDLGCRQSTAPVA